VADYYGWILFGAIVLAILSIFFVIGAFSEGENTWGMVFGGVLVTLIVISILSGFGYESDLTHDKAKRRAERGCINVALEQVDVMYQGQEYVLENATRRQWICAR
jgi:hypothetical protein